MRSTETILCHRPDDGALKVAPLVMSDAGTGQQFPQDRAAYGALINGSKPISRLAKAAGFDGGNITSNAGALLLGQVDRGLALVRRFANCFIDRREPRYFEHQVETLVGQRIRPGIGV